MAQIDVKPSYGLTDAEIASMLRASFTHASADADARVLAEARTDASRLIEAANAAMRVDPELLTEDESNAITKGILALARVTEDADPRAIKSAIERLSVATESFAAKRMDKSVSAALTGKSLIELG